MEAIMTDRRQFLKGGALACASALATSAAAQTPAPPAPRPARGSKARMALTYKPYTTSLKHVFTIATSSRTTTPGMLTEVAYDGLVGYGEASMPPYLGETQESCAAFLAKIDLGRYPNPFELETILADIGKLMNQPWYNIWGFNPARTPNTTFTIGIDTPEVVRQKVKEAAEYKVLKVKLGRDTDREMIETIRSVTDKPLTADANQGWKDRQKALEGIVWLKDKNVLFVEQPLPKEAPLEDFAWLTERSPLPIMADEMCQRLPDVRRIYGAVSGINIKLMKSTGMREAHQMLVLARSLGMKVMLGCMVETSCAISAASHLSPMVEWADLDGALLIDNDPFAGTTVVDGKVTLTNRPGIGVTRRV
jgi:L-alanine-DL-glutamate epimerase-like enolase superfamily enzyme